MIKRVKRVGHNTTAADLFTGQAREITVDITVNALRVHDGATPGGHETARKDVANVPAADAVTDGKMTASQAGDLASNTSALSAHIGAASGHPVATPSADGFESAADKTKLDGIEALADVNPTAAEILAALLTVDGSGSGLDADTLDGIESDDFALDANTVSAGTGLAGGGTIGSNPTINLDISTLGAAGALTGSEPVAVDQSGEKRTTTQSIANLGVAFPAGTKMLFQQTAAPTGWTKSTAHDNKALRVVTGTVSSGGSSGFTSVFGTGKVVGGTAISIAQMPSHTHPQNIDDDGGVERAMSKSSNISSPGKYGVHQAANLNSAATAVNTQSTGSGSTHNHTLPLNLQYIDIIVATKDA